MPIVRGVDRKDPRMRLHRLHMWLQILLSMWKQVRPGPMSIRERVEEECGDQEGAQVDIDQEAIDCQMYIKINA